MIAHFCWTEPGGHDENQDSAAVQAVEGDALAFLCAIADGQGGQTGAALASAIACKSCLETTSSYRLNQLLSPSNWPDILSESDRAVAAAEGAGYTTLAAFCLTENALCGSSSGDSAVLLLNANQSPLILTSNQEKNPPVGSGGATFVPFAARLIYPWTVLAMTDGVWKYVGWESVIAIASNAS